jgi:2-polyprenyl-6-hydroxyphenyl methylase/3-demethylubiquinone-9 3-methyltransferase
MLVCMSLSATTAAAPGDALRHAEPIGAEEEIRAGERFAFGRNWTRFLRLLNADRIAAAEASLQRMLETDTLAGLRFLDIGCGSGLFSLAARRLGAVVHSFDYDPASVACATELRRRFLGPDDPGWTIARGSALDLDYLRSLGTFDVVYSWGVLHHTGAMWDALDAARLPLAPGGKLWIAIYNDEGSRSRRWRAIKRTYNRLPRWARVPYTIAVSAPGEVRSALGAVASNRFGEWWTARRANGRARGMSHWRDIVDWVGGYPYETATPDQIFDFYKARGLALAKLKCGGVGLGCNEFVFEAGGPTRVQA